MSRRNHTLGLAVLDEFHSSGQSAKAYLSRSRILGMEAFEADPDRVVLLDGAGNICLALYPIFANSITFKDD